MTRSIAAIVALVCAVTGAVLAWHYPVAPVLALSAFVAWAACCFRWPRLWLLVIPGLLPVIGWSTWTGGFAFEEFDLLAMGAAAGAYAQLAAAASDAGRAPAQSRMLSLIVVLLLAGSYGVGIYRGVADAGGFVFDWIGSYDSSMNSVRIAKGFFESLLLWPLVRHALHADERGSLDLLARGLVLGLGCASLTAIWERVAFPGLLNFSSDYRTTALFWEMHVGGAALDGFLALTVPFVVWELRRSSGLLHLWLIVGLAVAATYACLTTFSRGVYIAVPVGLATLGILLQRGTSLAREPGDRGASARGAVLAVIAGVALYLSFRHGGYRALLAFGGTVAVALWVAPNSRGVSYREWAMGVGSGLVAGLAVSAIAMQITKGPYIVFGLVFALNVGLHLWSSGEPRERGVKTRMAAFGALLVSAGAAAMYWGGVDALTENAVSLALVLGLTVWSAVSATPFFPAGLRSRTIALGTLCLLAGAVAVFVGGGYMSDRFSTASDDFDLRMKHWKDGIGMLRTGTEWWLGKGAGRFPGDYFFDVTDSAHPGAFSLHREPGNPFMTLAGPRYPASWGDLFRIAQRVPAVPGKYTAAMDVRSPLDTELHLEICEQHLLYNAGCATAPVRVRANADWQHLSLIMDGRQLSRGHWFAPRLAFFAMAVATTAQAIDIRNVTLTGPDGSGVVANGNFAEGMARWIPISERYHLPWHAKNMALNVLFDQGIAGLVLFALVVIVALWRLIFGSARDHPMAPFLAASLIGFACVGVFDSLLDVPRIAFLFYLIVFTGLTVSATGNAGAGSRPVASQ